MVARLCRDTGGPATGECNATAPLWAFPLPSADATKTARDHADGFLNLLRSPGVGHQSFGHEGGACGCSWAADGTRSGILRGRGCVWFGVDREKSSSATVFRALNELRGYPPTERMRAGGGL